jgi:Ca2+-binding RTX toxin-like protein
MNETVIKKDAAPTAGQDLAFVIDTTGSMFDDIDAVKAQSVAIIDAIFDPSRGLTDSRIAVVGYNDPTVDVVLSFTNQPDFEDRKIAAKDAIDSLFASGGGDFPELTYTGLLTALDGSAGVWREDALSRKIIVFGDATAKDGFLAPQVYALANNLNVILPFEDEAISKSVLSDSVSVSTFGVSAEPGAPVLPVQIFTVAIGFNSGTLAEFEEIATETGGKFFNVSGASDIVDTILEVINLPIYTVGTSFVSITEGDSGEQIVTFLVNRDIADEASTVELNVGGTVDGDDIVPPSLTVEFAIGETSKEVSIAVKGDVIVEDDEILTLEIDSVSEDATVGIASASVGILNDDGGVVEPPVVLNPIDGTPDADSIEGTFMPDLIRGFAGIDTILGKGGSDVIYAGTGNDLVEGGFGFDTIYGEAGNDKLVGDAGDDSLFGGAGNDEILGGIGNDYIEGNAGNDILSGEKGQDEIRGGDGSDTISGGAGADKLFGGNGNDFLKGDAGDDLLVGGDGADDLRGGDGQDHLFGNDGIDLLRGGNGNDYLDGGDGDDNVAGGFGADIIIGGKGEDILTGNEGFDTFLFQSAADSSDINGVDQITDFTQGFDVIDLTAFGLSDISELGVFSDGFTTEVSEAVSGLKFVLQGDYSLANSDFMFA